MLGRKIIVLMSGEFDSPVASHILLSKGYELIFVHADVSPKYNDGSLVTKSRKSIERLNKVHNIEQSKLYLLNHVPFLDEVMNKANPKYTIVLWRRFMMKCAERIAKMERAWAIATGDNLAQVSSQTLANMRTIDLATSLPVLRPLLTWNKEEIIAKSREIGTYDIAVLPSQCLISPELRHTTYSNVLEIEREELKINIDALLERCMKELKIEVIK